MTRSNIIQYNTMEAREAKKGATPAVLKATLATFKDEMLKEHLWPQARCQLKEAWSAHISKHFTRSSTGPSANPSTMLCESHFKSSFGNVKAFNLKKLKLS